MLEPDYTLPDKIIREFASDTLTSLYFKNNVFRSGNLVIKIGDEEDLAEEKKNSDIFKLLEQNTLDINLVCFNQTQVEFLQNYRDVRGYSSCYDNSRYNACLVMPYVDNESWVLSNITNLSYEDNTNFGKDILEQFEALEVPYAITNMSDRNPHNILLDMNSKRLVTIDTRIGLYHTPSIKFVGGKDYRGHTDSVVERYEHNFIDMQVFRLKTTSLLEKQIFQCDEMKNTIAKHHDKLAEYYSGLPLNLTERANTLQQYLQEKLINQ